MWRRACACGTSVGVPAPSRLRGAEKTVAVLPPSAVSRVRAARVRPPRLLHRRLHGLEHQAAAACALRARLSWRSVLVVCSCSSVEGQTPWPFGSKTTACPPWSAVAYTQPWSSRSDTATVWQTGMHGYRTQAAGHRRRLLPWTRPPHNRTAHPRWGDRTAPCPRWRPNRRPLAQLALADARGGGGREARHTSQGEAGVCKGCMHSYQSRTSPSY